jgi:Cdc6-like AAA superfamily ATPase
MAKLLPRFSGGPERRSNTLRLAERNALFVSVEPLLYGMLADEGSGDPDFLRLIYTAKRVAYASKNTLPSLLERMPKDVRELAEDAAAARIGPVELELIDFLINYSDKTVLSITGDTGVGKTTFLNYILRTIRDECQSLQRFFPIIINCLLLADRKTDYNALADAASDAISHFESL